MHSIVLAIGLRHASGSAAAGGMTKQAGLPPKGKPQANYILRQLHTWFAWLPPSGGRLRMEPENWRLETTSGFKTAVSADQGSTSRSPRPGRLTLDRGLGPLNRFDTSSTNYSLN